MNYRRLPLCLILNADLFILRVARSRLGILDFFTLAGFVMVFVGVTGADTIGYCSITGTLFSMSRSGC